GWATARETRSTSSLKSGRARCSTKWTEWTSRRRGKRLPWPRPSFHFARFSCSVRWGEGRTRGMTMKASELRAKDPAQLSKELEDPGMADRQAGREGARRVGSPAAKRRADLPIDLAWQGF